MTTNSQNGTTTSAAVLAVQARLSAANQAAQAPAPAILRTGEVVTTTSESLGGKTYYHRVPGAKTHLPDGLEIQFLGGMFATKDPAIIAELDKVADKAASGIYTIKTVADNIVAADAKLAAEAADTTGDNKSVN
jgi:hypothetical protein